MLRFFGILFLLLGAVAAGYDYLQTGKMLEFSALGDIWFDLHKASLIGLQSGLENRVSLQAFSTVSPVLKLPAAPLFGGTGLVLFVLGSLLQIRAANRRAARL